MKVELITINDFCELDVESINGSVFITTNNEIVIISDDQAIKVTL